MVIYLLTALFLDGFGNYLIPLMLGCRDMAFPFVNMLSFWMYFLSVIILVDFFVESGPTGLVGRSILLNQFWKERQAVMVRELFSSCLGCVYYCLYNGRLNYITTVLQSRAKGMTLMRMPLIIGYILATFLGLLAFPALLVGP